MMAIPRLRNLDRFTPDAHTLFEAARLRREIQIQELRAKLDLDRSGVKRLIWLKWLREKGRLSS